MTRDTTPALTQVLAHNRRDAQSLGSSAFLPSSRELHRRAERDRNLVMNALLRSAIREFAKWLTFLARGTVGVARGLTDELRRQREIRTLLQLDDRVLADMGVGRSEIEYAVRSGRRAAQQVSRPQRRFIGRIFARGQAV